VPDTLLPVLVAHAGALPAPGELLAAVAAHVGVAGPRRAVVERPLVARQRRARPAVPPDVQRVLVPLRLVLVLKAVAAERTLVLLLGLVGSVTRGARQG